MADAAPLAPSRWSRIHSVWYRHVRVYSDTFLANATPAVFEPLLLLTAVGLGVGRYVDAPMNGQSYPEFMAAGILGMTAVYTAAYEATYASFVRLRYQRTYQAMLSTPLTPRDIFVGELLWCASKGLLYATLVGIVLALLGYVTSWLGLLIPLFGFLTAAAFAGLSLIVTSLVSNMNHFQFFFTAGLTPLVFFSGLMFPVQDLPSFLPTVGYVSPMFHVIESFRLACTGTEHLSAEWCVASPAVLVVMAVVLGGLGIRRMEGRLVDGA